MTTVPADSILVKTAHNDNIKVQCINIELSRITQKYLITTKTEYHTLPLPEDKVLKVVIKGLPSDITTGELTDELQDKGYEIKNIRQFSNATKKFPIYMVTLGLNALNKQIFTEHSIFYIPIKVESYKSNRPAQCFSCQRFGHSSLYCGYAPR